MPLVLNKEVQPDVHVGLWEICESPRELLSQLTLTQRERVIYETFQSEHRRQQWLSYRLIIKRILNLEQILDIDYDIYGRPRILNHHSRISVSHSQDYAAAIVSENHPVGIDIEHVHPRIERVVHKFLNQAELDDLKNDHNIEHMNICWSAKEALYKLYGRRKLNFKEHIHLQPFVYTGDGQMKGWIHKGEFKFEYLMNYHTLGQFILVYVVDKVD